MTGHTERVSGLELLRAAAILLVALRHMSTEAIPRILMPIHEFGWMGVDLFFVLSGYLIGSQLLKQHASGQKPSLGGFYARRALRVFPAFLFVLGLYFLIPQFREQSGIAPAWKFLTFTMNLGFDPTNGAAFSHAWSLCVEEFFYLIFPVLCIGLMRRRSLTWAVSTAFLLATAGVLVRLWSWAAYIHPTMTAYNAAEASSIAYSKFIYYPTYARLDGLLIGVTLAGIRTFRPAWWERAMDRGHSLEFAGSGLIACAVWLVSDQLSLASAVFGFPVLSAGIGLLLVSSVSVNGLLARVRIPGASIIAALAYSFYLTHKAVMHLDRAFAESWVPMEGITGLLFYVATSFAAAWLLYMCVERPFLRLRDRLLPTRPAVVMSASRSAGRDMQDRVARVVQTAH